MSECLNIFIHSLCTQHLLDGRLGGSGGSCGASGTSATFSSCSMTMSLKTNIVVVVRGASC